MVPPVAALAMRGFAKAESRFLVVEQDTGALEERKKSTLL